MARPRKVDALSSGERHRRYVRGKDLLTLKLPRPLLARLDQIAVAGGTARAEALAMVLAAWDGREVAAATVAARLLGVPLASQPRRSRAAAAPGNADEVSQQSSPITREALALIKPKSRAAGQSAKAPVVAASPVGDRAAMSRRPDASVAEARRKQSQSSSPQDDLFSTGEMSSLRPGGKRTKR